MSPPEEPRTFSNEYRNVSITFARLPTKNPAVAECLSYARRVAPTDATVFLQGETGTGKNFLAQAIHTASPRKEKAFYEVNCAAIPDTLVESALFGHRKGAFTGADTDQIGVFEQADKGTLFLDEIGDLSPSAQAKVLQVVERRTFRRVGETNKELHCDVRLIVATNKPLEELKGAKGFRSDLFYRLCEVLLHIPALRERPEDLMDLATEFLKEAAYRFGKKIDGFAPDFQALIRSYSWPGNIREMRGTIRGAAAVAEGPLVSCADIPPEMRPAKSGQAVSPTLRLEDVERAHIERVLRQAEGNVARSAEWLGISKSSLYERLKRLGISTPPSTPS